MALLIGGAGLIASPVDDYSRSFDPEAMTPETLASERYGQEDAVTPGPEGLRIQLDSGAAESGWKTPQTLRIGGNATISVEIEARSLPTPEQEDGVAVGLAIATQDLDQPDATLVRVVEPDGSARYRVVNQPRNQPRQPNSMRMVARPNVPGAPNPSPPRPTFPAEGDSFRLILRRDGSTLHYRAVDAASETPRDLGQMTLGTADLIGLKAFALNRNGSASVDILIKSVTIHADQLRGLGTSVRTIDGQVVYGEPLGLDGNSLVLGPPNRSASSSSPASSPSGPGIQAMEGAGAMQEGRVIVREGVIIEGGNPIVVGGVINGAIVEGPGDAPPPARPTPEDSPDPSPAPERDDAASPESKTLLALDVLDSIRFERSAALTGTFLGQPNVDLTGPHRSAAEDADAPPQQPETPDAPAQADQPAPPPGTVVPMAPPATSVVRPSQVPRVEPEPNGIRDIHLSLSGLREAELTQVIVSCQTDEGQTRWRLNTSGSTDWPLALRRSGDGPRADLFLEPPPGDCNGKTFQINLTYGDQQQDSVTVQADRPTDPGLAYDDEQPASSSGFLVRVLLDEPEVLAGTLEAMGEDSLTLSPSWPGHQPITIPFARVRAVRVEHPDRPEAEGQFSERLADRGAEDTLLARTRGGEVVAVTGILEGMEGDRIRILYQDQSRTIPLKSIEGIILAEGPPPDDPDRGEPIAVASMLDDQTISGFCRAIDEATWTIETPWGASLEVPAPEVRSVRFRSPRMTYLSDLEPTRVEQIPYFGRLLPWSRDRALGGGPLRIAGQTFDRGVAVHSYCELTYDLNGRFNTFEALVGFDDASNGLGRVDCRVFADETELFADPDLRADAPATSLRLPVTGAQTLRIVVDYGPEQDAGDRLIWANARLFRDPPPTP
ncbi:NPCBM/NEW2 domain-containing protein [Tautonia sp. JC769]|uniref:NPCBM/NEW2 domain-containing protein n=1 Tax=Tautonia sp. JC769 TaxID=3232135 RepID=UPI00345AF601